MKDFYNIFLRSIRIENFRCYKNFQIDFGEKINIQNFQHPKVNLTLLISKNGEGKSSLLDAIDIGLEAFICQITKSKEQYLKRSDIRLSINSENQFINNEMAKVTLKIVIKEQEYTIVRELSNSNKKTFTSQKDSSCLISFASEILMICNEQEVKTILPIVAYYGNHRIYALDKLWSAKGDTRKIHSRQYAYVNSMNANSNYKEFIQRYIYTQIVVKDSRKRQHEATKLKKNTTTSNIESYITRLHLCCDKLYDVIEKVFVDFGWNHLSYCLNNSCVFIERIDKHTGIVEEKIPINNLSSGIKSILGIVTDLFYRCFTLNPQSCIYKDIPTGGIVLIDDIDLYLHPLCQQQILPTLQNIFPNIQFIVTTHSPQVVSSVPAECVRIIDRGKVLTICGTEGADSSRILKRVFGTEPYPPRNPQRIKLQTYLSLVYDGKWNEAPTLALRDELNNIYQGEEPLLDQADLFIENEKFEKGI
jgi:predicted ATP-binding protein involved in virulence